MYALHRNCGLCGACWGRRALQRRLHHLWKTEHSKESSACGICSLCWLKVHHTKVATEEVMHVLRSKPVPGRVLWVPSYWEEETEKIQNGRWSWRFYFMEWPRSRGVRRGSKYSFYCVFVYLFGFITLIFPHVFDLFRGQHSVPRPSIWKVLWVHWSPMQECASWCPGHTGSTVHTGSWILGVLFVSIPCLPTACFVCLVV